VSGIVGLVPEPNCVGIDPTSEAIRAALLGIVGALVRELILAARRWQEARVRDHRLSSDQARQQSAADSRRIDELIRQRDQDHEQIVALQSRVERLIALATLLREQNVIVRVTAATLLRGMGWDEERIDNQLPKPIELEPAEPPR
jgi:hypothetical protein